MIKALLKTMDSAGNEGDILLLGLSKRNIELLTDDKHIMFSLEQFGFPGVDLCIVYGETENEIMESIKKEAKINNIPIE